MKRWTQGPAFRAAALAAPPEAEGADPAEARIAAWLARLRLLHGVPVHYLLPSARMLPVESIRFFQVDERWITVLIDGAFSLGRPVTGTDPAEAERLPRVHAQARRMAAGLRAGRLGLEVEEPADEAMSGFLLRSAVVSGWPHLEVEAFDAAGAQLLPLRVEALSAEILLGIFAGVVHRVKFREPAETLHFGIQQEHGARHKALKYVDAGPGGQLPGEIVEGALVTVPMRAGTAEGVIDVEEMAGLLLAGLRENQAISTTPWTPAAFALQMVQGVQEVDFVVEEAP